MRPIRVLRVIARMNVGGPAVQVVGLHTGLDPDRFEQRLLVGHVGSGEADYLTMRAPEVNAVCVRGLGRDPSVAGDLRAFAAVLRQIRKFRPDIIHTHTAKAGVVGRLAAVAGRTPLRVHTFHGHLLHGYFSPRITRVVIEVERALAHITSRLVAVGSTVRDDLVAAGIGRTEDYAVVPPGVDPKPAPPRPTARAALALAADVPVVAFVGRLTAVKRPDRLLDVVRIVSRRRPDVEFLVAGEGELLEDIRGRSETERLPIRFLGWRPDVETVFAAADVALLTSENEGMPVSLIEGAWAGRPAVTTDVGSASEVVIDGRSGFVVEQAPEQLADGVLRLLDDEDLRSRMGRAASEHARSAFSRQRLVGDMANLYEELLARRG